MSNYKHPSYQISDVLRLIYKSGLTTTSGGNISMRGDNGNIWITPGAVDKGKLTEKDIIKVKPDGSYEGLHKPSSELPFHLAIYRARPDIGSIIHAHPPALVSFSIVRQLPDTAVIPQAKYLCGKVGYAPYEMPGSEELGQSIAKEFEGGCNSVIMENHGTVVGGKDLSDAFMRFETLEFCARSIIRAGMIGGAKSLTEDDIYKFENRENLYPEFEHLEPSSEEKLIRHKLCEYIARACRQGLMISSYGTISARLDGDSFLINPTNINRRHVDLQDLVLIKDRLREQGKVPSRAVTLHAEIYKNHPDVDCIISTQSPNATAFCVAREQMDTRTIPESYIMLEDIPMMPYGCQYGGGSDLVARIGKHVPILLIENDSVLVTGKSILETFDRLEVAEFSANSLIDSHAIGELQPIKEHEIQELKEKFLVN
ncbi:MAG: class II aldolase/adducin family protein [Cyclobacteriaceae bacterium]